MRTPTIEVTLTTWKTHNLASRKVIRRTIELDDNLSDVLASYRELFWKVIRLSFVTE